MKTEDYYELRRDFNNAFEIKSNSKFQLISKQSHELEYSMMLEELNEYKKACEEKDLTEVLDAITDMLYLLFGISYKHGLSVAQLENAFQEVHRSNMSELWDGRVVKNDKGKVVKPITFSEPNLRKIIDNV